MIDAGLMDAMLCAKMFRKGLPPVSGGTLDQSRWFVEFADFFWREEDSHRNPSD